MRLPVVLQLFAPLEIIELINIFGHHDFSNISIMDIDDS